MVLGENMKFDRLIPLPANEHTPEPAPQPQSENPAAVPENIVTPTLRVNFVPSRRKTTRRIRIEIEGEFTIRHIALLHERLKAVFENFDYVDLVLQGITALDLAAVQLIYAWTAFSARSGKFVTIDARLENDERAMLLNAGLMDVLSTPKVNA